MQFIQLVISGLAQGCIYGLIALGFVLIYKATETVNFAQGELLMLGAFAGLFATTVLGLPYWLALIAAMAATALGLGKRINDTLGAGDLSEMSVSGLNGQVFIYSVGAKGALAVVAPAGVNLGLLHMEARDTAKTLALVL